MQLSLVFSPTAGAVFRQAQLGAPVWLFAGSYSPTRRGNLARLACAAQASCPGVLLARLGSGALLCPLTAAGPECVAARLSEEEGYAGLSAVAADSARQAPRDLAWQKTDSGALHVASRLSPRQGVCAGSC